MAVRALPGEEGAYLGIVRDAWEAAAAEMRRGYYWQTVGARRPWAIHPQSGVGQLERSDPGALERRGKSLGPICRAPIWAAHANAAALAVNAGQP